MYIRHCRTGHFSVAHSVVWDHGKLQCPITNYIISWMSQSESSLIKAYWYLHKMNAISRLPSKSRLLLGKSPQFDVEKPPCVLECRSCSKRGFPRLFQPSMLPAALHCAANRRGPRNRWSSPWWWLRPPRVAMAFTPRRPSDQARRDPMAWRFGSWEFLARDPQISRQYSSFH